MKRTRKRVMKRRNKYAKALASPLYRPRRVPDKRRKLLLRARKTDDAAG